jgi:HlyD family secretion protein
MRVAQLLIAAVLIGLVAGCGNNAEKNSYTGVLEGTEIKVPAMTGGQITGLFVEEGDYVAAGKMVAATDSTALVLQKQQLQATMDELLIQRDIARQAVAKANNDKNYISEKKERVANLVAGQSLPQQNLDDITNQLQAVETGLLTAQRQLKTVDAKQAQLEAQIAQVQKRINDCTIAAPSEGQLFNIFFRAGEAVPPMAPVLEIVALNQLETSIYIPEKLLPSVQAGQKVTARFDGLDEAREGVVAWISPRAEFTPKTIMTPETRTSLVYAVRIRIENNDRVLKHGMPVVITLD